MIEINKYMDKIMKNNLKIALSLLLVSTALSCSPDPNTIAGKEILIEQSTEKIYVAKASETQGASIYFKITQPLILERGNNNIIPNPSPPFAKGVRGIYYSPLLSKRGAGGEFSTKANTDGIPAKTPTDISKYVVYLIKDNSTSSYPLTGDPLNASNIVAGPFDITKTSGSQTIRFTNIQPLATGAYYVAVKAQDTSNVDIIKTNNGSGSAWTGTTSTTHASKVAVSSGAGVTVSSTYVVNPTTSLTINPNLLDAVGAIIDSNVSPTSGGNDTINAINGEYFINTIVGTGTAGFSGDGGQATVSQLNNPRAVGVDSLGNIYIADSNNHKIRKVTASSGIITTIAGSTAGFGSNNNIQATSAQFNFPRQIFIDSIDNIYIADYTDRVMKITQSTGVINVVAGNGNFSYSGDGGQATNAEFADILGLAVDAVGNIYIGDRNNNRVRKVTASTGIITTIAGTGIAGFSGDAGQATAAQLNAPRGVAVDAVGNVYICDKGNNRLRKLTASTGIITTVATGLVGDGMKIDQSGNVYFSTDDGQTIKKINKSGLVNTIAGDGTAGYTGDGGIATSAKLNYPGEISLDLFNNVYIADGDNHRIRKLYKN